MSVGKKAFGEFATEPTAAGSGFSVMGAAAVQQALESQAAYGKGGVRVSEEAQIGGILLTVTTRPGVASLEVGSLAGLGEPSTEVVDSGNAAAKVIFRTSCPRA